ncbi:MAG TPA: hypothetical protein VEW46_07215 [Pyrinomonadaceae bacterium]|nr:hypothetical protein [Pyrinomonadaceae bacterium]
MLKPKRVRRRLVLRSDGNLRVSSYCFLLVFGTISLAVCLSTDAVFAQHSIAQLQQSLRQVAAFDEADFATLAQGQTVVNSLPTNEKSEVAVCGLVGLEAPAEVFLQSFRDSMTRKSSPAILEIGRFSNTPTVDDLQGLTFEQRDLDDLKECVVGDCELKLSATMIERLHKELDAEAPDYQVRATSLLKLMLVDYVRDYLARGEAALIKYYDKSQEVRLADEQRTLMAASTYMNNVLPEVSEHLKGLPKAEASIVENAIVWSKIKFGLKPVIAINHITVYKRQQNPQVVVASRQIYANHYFDSSLALTAFTHIPGATPGSYLFYENRSRVDGLEGAFGKFKRGIVEGKALDGLKIILESSRANLTAHALNQTESATTAHAERSWRGGRVRVAYVFLGLLLITGIVALLTVGNYEWKGGLTGRLP